MKETILVTGGAGFIGSHLCDALLEKGAKVVCLDNFNDYYSPEQKRKNIIHNLEKDNFCVEEVDIRDFAKLNSVFEKYKIAKIVHLAARAGVRPSLADPFIYEDTNIKGTLNLLECSRKHKITNFIFGSSSSVYGTNTKIPFSEEDDTSRAISPYAATKKAGEVLCHVYSHIYGLNISCLRFFTVYGPRGRPDMAPYIFTKKIIEGKPIEMYGDGTTQRDYTYIDDIISGIVASLDKPMKYEIFNLGNSKTIELKDFIATIESCVGKKAIVHRKELQKGDVPLTYADISKAKAHLNYSPKTDIAEGMKKFTEWYKNR